jgi:acetyl-CoA carboxylase alpha subunit
VKTLRATPTNELVRVCKTAVLQHKAALVTGASGRIERALDDLAAKSVPDLLERRYAKFRRMGQLAAAVTG